MRSFGTEADGILERLAALDSAEPDPARVRIALRKLHADLGLPFPEYRWVPELKDAALGPLRAGLGVWLDAGAVRHPTVPFHPLQEAAVAAAATSAFKAAWRETVFPVRQRCGNEPADFRSDIRRRREGAARAAVRAFDRLRWVRRLEAGLKDAAATAVREAGGLIRPADRPAAVESLVLAARGSCVDPTQGLTEAAESFAEWRYRNVPLDRPLKPVLHLLDAVEAGLCCFWPSPAAVVAVPRPNLS